MGFIEGIRFFSEANRSISLADGGSFVGVIFKVQLFWGWGKKGNEMLDVLFVLMIFFRLEIKTELIAPERHFGSSLIDLTFINGMILERIGIFMLNSIPIEDLHLLLVLFEFVRGVKAKVMPLKDLSD